jgi:hypothetical protein
MSYFFNQSEEIVIRNSDGNLKAIATLSGMGLIQKQK